MSNNRKAGSCACGYVRRLRKICYGKIIELDVADKRLQDGLEKLEKEATGQ
jgi:hypothetical protein